MKNNYTIEIEQYLSEVQVKADKIVDKFIIGFFVLGICFAPLYQTWVFSLSVGILNVLLYLLAKVIPNKMMSRLVISFVFSVFMLQFIGQSHGMAEFHFFFFTNIAILIIYQDWRVMIPYTVFAIAHHSTFFYFQLSDGSNLGEYFINYTEVDLQVLFFHFGIAILMAVISGWWAVIFRDQSIRMITIQGEMRETNEELTQSFEELKAIQEELTQKKEQLERIFEGVPAMIYQFKMTPDGKTSFPLVSSGSESAFGVTAQTLMADASSVINHIHPEDVNAFQQTVIESAQTLKVWNLDLRTNIGGVNRWIRGSSKPIALKDGSILWSGIVQEVSALKETELKIEQQNQELQNSLAQVISLRQKSEASRHKVEELLKNITASINYALRIQNAIIPKESDLQKHLDCFVLSRPRDIVSGDFYWFAEKGNHKIIAVADCTGHGVSGAFMTMIGNNILNQIVHDQEIHAPDQILNLISPLLEKTLVHSEGKVRDGMDISIITIYQQTDSAGARIEYAGAMNPLYYIQNQEFQEIKADKIPIGGTPKEGFSYKKHSLPLTNDITQPTTIYLCSDGFQDQFGGEQNRKFMVGNFKKLLFQISEKPIDAQKKALAEHFDKWKGKEKQTDDVLVLGIRL